MARRVLRFAAGSVVVLGLLFGTDAWSYVRTVFQLTREVVQEHVPLEFEIGRARGMIQSLGGEIRRQMEVIAEEETAVERLEARRSAIERKLAGEEKAIRRLRDKAASGRDMIQVADRQFALREVRADLDARFRRFETQEATCRKLGEILAARRKGLVAARSRLAELKNARRQFQVDVENVEANRKMLGVAQAQSKQATDSGKLSRTRSLIDQISARLKVAQRLVEDESAVGSIPVDQVDVDLMDRITGRFGRASQPQEPSVANGGTLLSEPDMREHSTDAVYKESSLSLESAEAPDVIVPTGADPEQDVAGDERAEIVRVEARTDKIAVAESGIDNPGAKATQPLDNSRELLEWLIQRFDRMFDHVLMKAFDSAQDGSVHDGEPADHAADNGNSGTPAAVRMWTDNTGRYRACGQLTSVVDNHVRILKTNGRYTTVPCRRLSEMDRFYVAQASTVLVN